MKGYANVRTKNMLVGSRYSVLAERGWAPAASLNMGANCQMLWNRVAWSFRSTVVRVQSSSDLSYDCFDWRISDYSCPESREIWNHGAAGRIGCRIIRPGLCDNGTARCNARSLVPWRLDLLHYMGHFDPRILAAGQTDLSAGLTVSPTPQAAAKSIPTLWQRAQ